MKTRLMEYVTSDAGFFSGLTVYFGLCWSFVGMFSNCYFTFTDELFEFGKQLFLGLSFGVNMYIVGLVVFFRLKELSYWTYTIAQLSIVTVMYALSFPLLGEQYPIIIVFFLFGLVGVVMVRMWPEKDGLRTGF